MEPWDPLPAPIQARHGGPDLSLRRKIQEDLKFKVSSAAHEFKATLDYMRHIF